MSFDHLSSFRASFTSKKSGSTSSSSTDPSLEAFVSRPRRSTISTNLSRKLHSFLGYHDLWEDIPTTTITPSQAQSMTHLLSLPLSAPLLSTKIAWLGAPLSRHKDSLWPKDLCETHTWFEPRYLHELTQLIAKELWERSEGLYAFPCECMGEEVRGMLYDTLLRYCDIFTVSIDTDRTKGPEIIGSPYEPFAKPECPTEICIACKLSILFQDRIAVKSLATLCKGRKRHGYTWPELLAFLEPVEKGKDPNWRDQWIRDGKAVRRERRRVRLWRQCGGEKGTAGKLIRNADAGEECPIVYTRTQEAKFEDRQSSSKGSGRQTFGYSECVREISDDLEDENEGFKGWTEEREKAYQALHGIGVRSDTADVDEWLPECEERLQSCHSRPK